jgi:nitrate/nitrite transporter NarK
LLFPAVTSLGSGPFPSRFRGTGTTIALGMCELGVALASPLFGWIIDAWGFNAMYAVSVTLTVTLGTVYLVRSQDHADDEQVATPTASAKLESDSRQTAMPCTAADPADASTRTQPVTTPRKSLDVSA